MDQDGAVGVPAVLGEPVLGEPVLGVAVLRAAGPDDGGFDGVLMLLPLDAAGFAGHGLVFGVELPSVILPLGFVALAGRKLESVGLLGGRDATAVELIEFDAGIGVLGDVTGRATATPGDGAVCRPPQQLQSAQPHNPSTTIDRPTTGLTPMGRPPLSAIGIRSLRMRCHEAAGL
jgi:hypothetical protein